MNIILFDGPSFFSRQDERYKHIRKILRKVEGDTFSAGIVNGAEGVARITRIDESGISFVFEPACPMRPLFPVHLIIGFPRPIQLKRLLRDTASLGAASIFLSSTDLGEKSYQESTLVDRGAAMNSLLDGCQQAGGTALPRLELFSTLEEAIAAAGKGCRILLDTVNPESSLLHARLENVSAHNPLVLAIGSERGWSERERTLFCESGFSVASLGSRILRTETAVSVALGISLAKLGYMEATN